MIKQIRLCVTVTFIFTTVFAHSIVVKNKGQQVCPYCQLPVIGGDSHLDYRVTVTRDGKSQDYRCLMCAMADAKELKGDLAINAPAEAKGQWVRISRNGGKWSVSPEGAVFAFAKGSHVECQDRYRAITSQAAFEGYSKAYSQLLRSAKPLNLAEFIQRSR